MESTTLSNDSSGEDGKGTFSHVSNASGVGSKLLEGRHWPTSYLGGLVTYYLQEAIYLRETLNRVEQMHHHVSCDSEDCIRRTSCIILLGLCEGKAACPGNVRSSH
jgi:hypothetical protein